jgi:hypothetical protein
VGDSTSALDGEGDSWVASQFRGAISAVLATPRKLMRAFTAAEDDDVPEAAAQQARQPSQHSGQEMQRDRDARLRGEGVLSATAAPEGAVADHLGAEAPALQPWLSQGPRAEVQDTEREWFRRSMIEMEQRLDALHARNEELQQINAAVSAPMGSTARQSPYQVPAGTPPTGWYAPGVAPTRAQMPGPGMQQWAHGGSYPPPYVPTGPYRFAPPEPVSREPVVASAKRPVTYHGDKTLGSSKDNWELVLSVVQGTVDGGDAVPADYSPMAHRFASLESAWSTTSMLAMTLAELQQSWKSHVRWVQNSYKSDETVQLYAEYLPSHIAAWHRAGRVKARLDPLKNERIKSHTLEPFNASVKTNSAITSASKGFCLSEHLDYWEQELITSQLYTELDTDSIADAINNDKALADAVRALRTGGREAAFALIRDAFRDLAKDKHTFKMMTNVGVTDELTGKAGGVKARRSDASVLEFEQRVQRELKTINRDTLENRDMVVEDGIWPLLPEHTREHFKMLRRMQQGQEYCPELSDVWEWNELFDALKTHEREKNLRLPELLPSSYFGSIPIAVPKAHTPKQEQIGGGGGGAAATVGTSKKLCKYHGKEMDHDTVNCQMRARDDISVEETNRMYSERTRAAANAELSDSSTAAGDEPARPPRPSTPKSLLMLKNGNPAGKATQALRPMVKDEILHKRMENQSCCRCVGKDHRANDCTNPINTTDVFMTGLRAEDASVYVDLTLCAHKLLLATASSAGTPVEAYYSLPADERAAALQELNYSEETIAKINNRPETVVFRTKVAAHHALGPTMMDDARRNVCELYVDGTTIDSHNVDGNFSFVDSSLATAMILVKDVWATLLGLTPGVNVGFETLNGTTDGKEGCGYYTKQAVEWKTSMGTFWFHPVLVESIGRTAFSIAVGAPFSRMLHQELLEYTRNARVTGACEPWNKMSAGYEAAYAYADHLDTNAIASANVNSPCNVLHVPASAVADCDWVSWTGRKEPSSSIKYVDAALISSAAPVPLEIGHDFETEGMDASTAILVGKDAECGDNVSTTATAGATAPSCHSRDDLGCLFRQARSDQLSCAPRGYAAAGACAGEVDAAQRC